MRLTGSERPLSILFLLVMVATVTILVTPSTVNGSNSNTILFYVGTTGDDRFVNATSGVVILGIAGLGGNDNLINRGVVRGIIDGGPDNDTITNHGSVLGEIFGNNGHDTILNSGGVGNYIVGEGGNDTIVHSGSVRGSIYGDNGPDFKFGPSGNDTIVILGDATVGGIVDGGPGFDRIIFEGAGERSGDYYANFENLSITGPGTTILVADWGFPGGTLDIDTGAGLVVAGTVTSGSTVNKGLLTVNGELISAVVNNGSKGSLGGVGLISGNAVNHGTVAPGNSTGILTISGDYVHGQTAVYAVEVSPDGQSDLVAVYGRATLGGGTLEANLKRALYPDQLNWELLTARQGITGTFDNLEAVGASRFVRLDLVYGENAVKQVVNRSSYGVFGLTDQERDTGMGLDGVVPWAANRHDALSDLLLRMDFDFSGDEIRQVLASASPALYAAFDTATWSLMTEVDNIIRRQSDNLYMERLGRPVQAVTPASGLSVFPEGAGTESWRVWGQGFGTWQDLDSDGNQTGFSADGGGFLIGADRWMRSNLNIGFHAGYSRMDIDMDGGGDSGDQDAFHVGVKALASRGETYLDGALMVTATNNDSTRDIRYAGTAGTASADFDGWALTGRVGGGVDFQLDRFVIGPTALMRYSHLSRDGFSESGGSVLQLSVDKSQEDYLDTLFGVRVSGEFVRDTVRMMPRMTLGWQYQWAGSAPDVTARFAGYPAAPFTVDGPDVSDNALVAQLGVAMDFARGWSGSADYALLANDDFQSHSLAVEVAWQFGENWTAQAGYAALSAGDGMDQNVTVDVNLQF